MKKIITSLVLSVFISMVVFSIYKLIQYNSTYQATGFPFDSFLSSSRHRLYETILIESGLKVKSGVRINGKITEKKITETNIINNKSAEFKVIIDESLYSIDELKTILENDSAIEYATKIYFVKPADYSSKPRDFFIIKPDINKYGDGVSDLYLSSDYNYLDKLDEILSDLKNLSDGTGKKHEFHHSVILSSKNEVYAIALTDKNKVSVKNIIFFDNAIFSDYSILKSDNARFLYNICSDNSSTVYILNSNKNTAQAVEKTTF